MVLRRNYDFVKQTVVREFLLEQCCYGIFAISFQFMYAAVSDISYMAESVASWEKESGSVAKLWVSNSGLAIGQY